VTDWAICIASGPSLTRADCDAVRAKGYAIAVNCAAFFAPWADELYAADMQFWNYYGPKLQWFKGQRFSRSRVKGVETWRGKGWPTTGGNSGHQALQKAVSGGYKRIALLGYDHQHTGGQTHFHGDHRRDRQVRLGNAKNVHHWVRKMERTAKDIERMGVEVVNLSRETALTCFPRMTVEQWLDYRHHARSE
jgi:hypothetical protein